MRRRRVESRSESVTRSFTPQPRKQEYLLVDGYNIIFAWDELKELARENMDAARGILLDKLCNYQGMKQMEVIAVLMLTVWRDIRQNARIIITFMWYLQKKQRQQINILKNLHI